MVIGIITLILLWLVVITTIFIMLNEFLEKIIFDKIIDILLTVSFGIILALLVSFLMYTTYEVIFK